MSTATSSTARFQDIFPITEHSDAALIRSFRAGNEGAFAQLISSCGRRPYKTALALTKNPADAEDAVQEAQLRALVNLGGFRGESSFSTWFIRITVNTALMVLRKKHLSSVTPFGLKEQEPDGEAIILETPDRRETALEMLERQDRQAILAKALGELSPNLRAVIICRDIEGMTTAETAALLAIHIPAVKSRLLRARQKMRERYLQLSERKTKW